MDTAHNTFKEQFLAKISKYQGKYTFMTEVLQYAFCKYLISDNVFQWALTSPVKIHQLGTFIQIVTYVLSHLILNSFIDHAK